MTLILSLLALVVALGALAVAWTARNDAAATRAELKRHRHSHTLQAEERGARRHGEAPGPEPEADEHAAPPTAAMQRVDTPTGRRVPPPGVDRPPTAAQRRRAVRDDPQA
jgi:hypothetical protein